MQMLLCQLEKAVPTAVPNPLSTKYHMNTATVMMMWTDVS
jgi:hypothetical protein